MFCCFSKKSISSLIISSRFRALPSLDSSVPLTRISLFFVSGPTRTVDIKLFYGVFFLNRFGVQKLKSVT